MKISELRGAVCGASIADLWMGGWFESADNQPRFYASLWAYYVEIAGSFLAIRARKYTGEATLSFVSEIPRDPDLEDDMTFTTMSIGEMRLRHPESENRIHRVVLWGASESDEGVECQAARIELSPREALFFDPSFYFGIRLGGNDDQDEWIEHSAPWRKEALVLE
ncbi:MAG: hypothetical protein JNK05_17635 [Myxococcales bacterium]|nr:hypothetical protein [Myxococcales bacterium]